MQTITLTLSMPFIVTEEVAEAAKLILASERIKNGIAIGTASVIGARLMDLIGPEKSLFCALDFTDSKAEITTAPTTEQDAAAFRKSLDQQGAPTELIHDGLVRDAKATDAKLRDAPAQSTDHDQSKADADAVLARVFGAGNGAVH